MPSCWPSRSKTTLALEQGARGNSHLAQLSMSVRLSLGAAKCLTKVSASW